MTYPSDYIKIQIKKAIFVANFKTRPASVSLEDLQVKYIYDILLAEGILNVDA